ISPLAQSVCLSLQNYLRTANATRKTNHRTYRSWWGIGLWSAAKVRVLNEPVRQSNRLTE
ncbi:MAG TPA: hypothetical protein VGF13_01960, partial [Verrucomicrobiae bacterium]